MCDLLNKRTPGGQIDNYTAICQRAPDYIHAEECILTCGYSRIVELFLRAAGAKRRFQVCVPQGYSLSALRNCSDMWRGSSAKVVFWGLFFFVFP